MRTRVVRPRGALYGADGLEPATAELLLERALPVPSPDDRDPARP